MHRPVCRKCEVELRCLVNGVGCLDYSDGKYIQIWDSDLWACPSCGYELVTGFGQRPIADDFDTEKLEKTISAYNSQRQVIRNFR